MGYRNYFYLVPKEIVRDIKKLNTNEDLAKYVAGSKHFHEQDRKEALKVIKNKCYDDYYIGIYDFGQELHEFGKLYFDSATYEAITVKSKPFFNKKSELAKEYSHYDAKIVGKEALKAVISCYLNKVIKYYEDLLKTPEQLRNEAREQGKSPFGIEESTVEQKAKNEIIDKLMWLKLSPLNLDESNKLSISNSWLYEYQMFDLVHKLKTVDFKKYDIVECGW